MCSSVDAFAVVASASRVRPHLWLECLSVYLSVYLFVRACARPCAHVRPCVIVGEYAGLLAELASNHCLGHVSATM